MKQLIVGLGNPGAEYEFTRHNIGFEVIDVLAKLHNISLEKKNFGWIGSGRIKNKILFLLKPDTYMNLSGKAVKHYLNKEKFEISNLLIITDDLSLPLGKIRIRSKGSDGGHNGLKSITEELKTENYSRLRFGIGSDFEKGKQVNYVLGKWKSEEIIVLKEKIELSCNAIECFALEGVEKAMNQYNNK